MILGIVFIVIGLLHGILKYLFIRDAARDVFGGGGAPVMDFVIFVPLWIAFGAGLLLKHLDAYPFPFFGLVLYFALAAVLYGVMELEYKLGEPEVKKQLEQIEKRAAMERQEGKAASEGPPVDEGSS